MKFNLDKTLIACGFIGPAIFFFTIYFLFALMYPGYDIKNQTISELGGVNSPVKTLANVFGFSLFGIFIMLFAFGVFRSKEINVLGKISSFFFFVTGILMYLVGIFHGKLEYSILASLHNMTSNYQFPILAIGLVLFAFSAMGNKKIRWLTPLILILGLITLAFAYIFLFTHNLELRGIWQRAAIGLPYLIVMIISISLYRLETNK